MLQVYMFSAFSIGLSGLQKLRMDQKITKSCFLLLRVNLIIYALFIQSEVESSALDTFARSLLDKGDNLVICVVRIFGFHK